MPATCFLAHLLDHRQWIAKERVLAGLRRDERRHVRRRIASAVEFELRLKEDVATLLMGTHVGAVAV